MPLFAPRSLAIALALAVGAPASAVAQDLSARMGDTLRFDAAIGYAFINSDEIVYDGGNRISHLFWESRAPTLSASLAADMMPGWSITARGEIAGFATSFMSDYDWIPPFVTGYAFGDWTHRSQHPDTLLHHYFDGDITIARHRRIGATDVTLLGGVSYTDVAWTANGGPFVYSETGFRADTGTFALGQRGISYQQRYPGLFLGAGASTSLGRWTFEGRVRGGLSIGATDTDYHWVRSLRFEEQYTVAPFAEAHAKVRFDVNRTSSIYLSGTFRKFFHAMGSTTIYDIASGTQLAPAAPNAAGMTLRTISLNAGVKIRF